VIIQRPLQPCTLMLEVMPYENCCPLYGSVRIDATWFSAG
jgi:hypothetical protein